LGHGIRHTVDDKEELSGQRKLYAHPGYYGSRLGFTPKSFLAEALWFDELD
jgi:hypothetical protein